MIGKEHGELAVFAIAFDADDDPRAVSGMAYALANEEIGRRRGVWSAPAGCAANVLLGALLVQRGEGAAATRMRRVNSLLRIEYSGPGFVAARFAGVGEGALFGIDEFAWNFLEKNAKAGSRVRRSEPYVRQDRLCARECEPSPFARVIPT